MNYRSSLMLLALLFGSLSSMATAQEAQTVKSTPAAEILKRARENRAWWKDFPGFTAEISVTRDDAHYTGQLKVSPEGTLEIVGKELAELAGLERRLDSLISHRLSSGSESEAAAFVNQESAHPLGQLIRLDDSAMASTYRVKSDVIRQVNRKNARGNFTISVLEVNRNPEGKYLPGTYTVNFWQKDGSLTRSTVVKDQWKRVGKFDLPLSQTVVTTGKDLHQIETIEFRNHQLHGQSVVSE